MGQRGLQQMIHPCSCCTTADALLQCYKTCSYVHSFTGCCTEEYKAFWDCYTDRRVRALAPAFVHGWLVGSIVGWRVPWPVPDGKLRLSHPLSTV